MKKLLLILTIAVLLVSCSSSDDSSNNNSHLNPPNWIQGTWVQYVSEDSDIIFGGFKFTSNDFCVVTNYGNQETCFGQVFFAPPTETITNTEYKFTINIGQILNSYHFIKISDTQIKYENNDGIERIYTKK